MKRVGWWGVAILLAGMLWLQWPAGRENGLFAPDNDGDLIRDDVGALIASRFAANPAANAALRQLARSWQQGVQQDEARWPQAQLHMRQAVGCVLSDAVLGRARMSAETMYHFMQQMHGSLFDTPARLARWQRFEAATAALPHQDLPLNPCVFDPAALAG